MFYFDVTPLSENYFTGVTNVIANLAQNFLKIETISYVVNDHLIEPEIISKTLDLQNGIILRSAINSKKGSKKLDNTLISNNFCLYGHNKHRNLKWRNQGQIIHDLSPLLLPDAHQKELINIVHHYV